METPSYTAIVLDGKSKLSLLHEIGDIPVGFEIICHHMTVNLGDATKGPSANLLGQKAVLITTDIGQNEKVIAVKVNTDVPSNNTIKHITIAVNRSNGGKPFDSNKITEWTPIKPLELHGTVVECGKGDVVLTGN